MVGKNFLLNKLSGAGIKPNHLLSHDDAQQYEEKPFPCFKKPSMAEYTQMVNQPQFHPGSGEPGFNSSEAKLEIKVIEEKQR